DRDQNGQSDRQRNHLEVVDGGDTELPACDVERVHIPHDPPHPGIDQRPSVPDLPAGWSYARGTLVPLESGDGFHERAPREKTWSWYEPFRASMRSSGCTG